MTAEIGIMNKNGVVLAADSAVTISNGVNSKIFNSAKKIFTLSAKHSIGIMIYGNANFMSIPWEIIIKQFRQYIGKSSLNDFNDYVESFEKFLVDNKYFKDDTNIKYFVLEQCSILFNYIMTSIVNLRNTSNVDSSNGELFYNILNQIYEENKKRLEITDISNYKEFIYIRVNNNITQSNLNQFNLVFNNIDEVLEKFYLTLSILISDANLDANLSGVVISGYGNNDIFPLISSKEYIGILNSKLIKRDGTFDQINLENTASIVPFAQSEMIETIINGIDPYLAHYYNEVVNKLISENGIKPIKHEEYLQNIANFQLQNHINPIIEIIGLQPIEEMAATAKTFLDITSFKRKIVNTLETVGGPIDVLAITKGDGPVWIERKFYFDINKNIDFQNRKRSQNE